jgi:hypothetical protein
MFALNAMILATLQEQPDFSRFAADVPAALTALIAACLAKAPEQRPSTARELARRLHAIDLGSAPGWDAQAAQAFWQKHLPRRLRSKQPSAPGSEPEAQGEERVLMHASASAATEVSLEAAR